MIKLVRSGQAHPHHRIFTLGGKRDKWGLNQINLSDLVKEAQKVVEYPKKFSWKFAVNIFHG
ncbi:MAG: hypothetical protein FGO69_08690 [Methanobacterium sp.]|nr:MAG: hypothetical protein FGO69_08690 [Methanobacterium sp.]